MAGDAVVLTVTWLGLTVARSWLREAWTWDLIPGEAVLHDVDVEMHAWLIALIVPAWLLALSREGTYAPNVARSRLGLTPRLLRAGFVATLGVLGLCFLGHATDYLSRSLFVGFSVAAVFALAAGRWALGFFVRSRGRPLDGWQVLLVGSVAEVSPLQDAIAAHPEWGIEVVGRVGATPRDDGALGGLDALDPVLDAHPVDQVFVAGGRWDEAVLQRVADVCEERGVRFGMGANFLGLRTARAELDDLEGFPILTFSSTPSSTDALALKRLLDIVGALFLGMLSAPLLVLTPLLIRLQDGGPALFTQERVGQHGRRFRMLKFRSMRVNAEAERASMDHLNEMSGPVFKVGADPRVTRVGSLIRRWSIDELPQLWNVLRGEMSLVGPRPPLPDEVGHYERWQLRRLSMQPGLTCIWQVSGRSELDFDDWMRLDLEYIDNWSLGLDLKLLMMTVPAVLLGTGAR